MERNPLRVIDTGKYGYRQFGFGYYWSDPNNLTIHLDLWRWSIRWEFE